METENGVDMNEYLLKEVHSEFARRVDEENKRQNIRLAALERAVQEIGRLTVSIEKMAGSRGDMAEEQKKQGERLDEIEKKPAKRWDVVITGAISAIVGALMAAMLAGAFH